MQSRRVRVVGGPDNKAAGVSDVEGQARRIVKAKRSAAKQ